MDAKDLARQVARALAKDYGGALERETERALEGKSAAPAADAGTRSITGDAFTRVAEAAVIADFLVSIAVIAHDRWAKLRNKAFAKAEIAKSVATPPEISAEVAERVIDTTVDKISRGG